jgi:hypothetical protein
MPAGTVPFDAATGHDTIPWKGYATGVSGLLAARLLSPRTLSFAGRQATYRPASTWGLFHRATGLRILRTSYKTRREATSKASLLDGFDWSQPTWPDVTAEHLARLLNPTPEQILKERVATLEHQLREAQARWTAMQGIDQYVLVNATRGPVYGEPGERFVVPGQDTHTFHSLQRASHALLDMALEYGHDLSSAQVYRLAPVPERALHEAFFAAVKAREQEIEAWYPDGDAPMWLTLRPESDDHLPACAHCFKYPMCGHCDAPDDAPGGECTKALAVTGDEAILETSPWPS